MMPKITADVAAIVGEITQKVGSNEMHARQAVDQLKELLNGHYELSRAEALWELTNLSNEVLAALFPEKRAIFLPDGDRSGPAGGAPVPLEVSLSVIIRAIMRGLSIFDVSSERKSGAEQILSACPSLLPKTDSPFADTEKVWSHTHLEFNKDSE